MELKGPLGLGLIGGLVLGLIGHSTRWFGRGRGPFALSPLRGFINFFIFRIELNIAGLEMLSRLLLSELPLLLRLLKVLISEA